MNKIKVTTFYHFSPLSGDALETLAKRLTTRAAELDIKGLLIIGVEGTNSTIAGAPDAIETFKSNLEEIFGFSGIIFKDSFTDKPPFKRFKVDIREEIVTLDRPEIKPAPGQKDWHLSPKDWDKTLKQEKDIVLIDTRNDYETKLGKFKDAITPPLTMFNQFPDYVAKSGIPKDKKVLMYCTGGIRCEKALLEMRSQGYDNVYQLDGGILKYLEEFPNQEFEGECFVFDSRVAVDQNLQPSSNFKLCPHCGDPGDQLISCTHCRKDAIICKDCKNLSESRSTCSKNCEYQFRFQKARAML